MMRFVSLAFAASACTFSPGSASNAPDGGTAIRPDTFVPPDAGMCLQTGPSCIGNVLRVCKVQGQLPTDTRCDWGCSSNGAPHCQNLKPAGGAVQPSDLLTFPGAMPITISQGVTINTDTGSISNVRIGGTGVISGIGYTVRNNVGVFTFESLTINGPITFTGNNGVAFVAVTDISVRDLIDARGSCTGTAAGPGGSSGGNPHTDGQGSGRGTGGTGTNDDSSGGGGGGYGGDGAKGGKSQNASATNGGTTYGTSTIMTLIGGSGGGGGGGTNGGVGGGGGGALQFAASGTITVEGNGKINAGGCAGKGSTDAGGGGGAGGTILVEALTIHLVSGSQIGANGGGGGGGAGSSGSNANFNEVLVQGGAAGNNGGDGGGGAARLPIGGTNGINAQNAGGGGGGTGRIRMNTIDGVIMIDSNVIMTPHFGDINTSASRGTAAVTS